MGGDDVYKNHQLLRIPENVGIVACTAYSRGMRKKAMLSQADWTGAACSHESPQRLSLDVGASSSL